MDNSKIIKQQVELLEQVQKKLVECIINSTNTECRDGIAALANSTVAISDKILTLTKE